MRNQLNLFRRGLADGFIRPVGLRTIEIIMVSSAGVCGCAGAECSFGVTDRRSL